MKIILASASPRRNELLKKLYREFTVFPADIEEILPEDIGPEFAPLFLAAEKAEAVADRFPKDLIIASDTIVVCDGEIFGKPKDSADAKRMIQKLSGNTHKVITGCCIRIGDAQTTFSEESLVTFYELKENEINSYVESGEPMGKAGAYAIQQTGGLFVQRIEGDFYNIVGLPIARLKREIESLLEEICQCTESTKNTSSV